MFSNSNLNSLTSRLQSTFEGREEVFTAQTNYARGSTLSINGKTATAVNTIVRGDRCLLIRDADGFWSAISEQGSSATEQEVTYENLVISRHSSPRNRQAGKKPYVLWYKTDIEDGGGGGGGGDPIVSGSASITIFNEYSSLIYNEGSCNLVGIGNLVLKVYSKQVQSIILTRGDYILTLRNKVTNQCGAVKYSTLILSGPGAIIPFTVPRISRPNAAGFNFDDFLVPFPSIMINVFVNGTYYFSPIIKEWVVEL